MRVTSPTLRCEAEHPLAEVLNKLNPRSFCILGVTNNGKWVHLEFGEDQVDEIDAVIDETLPIVTYARWNDPVERELWIPGEWLVDTSVEEVSHGIS